MLYKNFKNFEEFLAEYKVYEFDKCTKCEGIRELVETEVYYTIGDRSLYSPNILVMRCEKCGYEVIPEYTKEIIYGAYRNMLAENQNRCTISLKEYKKKFEYCENENYIYDHRDYYNIPGLKYDEEHRREGFLAPVYFDKKALVYFISVPEYNVDIFSESYGQIAKTNPEGAYEYDWVVPFGFNKNGKMVMWLGDIDSMDSFSRGIIKPFNIESDHKIMNSEFYQAQMKCVFSDPITEKQIVLCKKHFIENVKKKHDIDLSHLVEECEEHEAKINRPVIFSEQSVNGVINAFDKVLVEGFNVKALKELYEKLYSEDERTTGYQNWASIKFLEALIDKWCMGMAVDIKTLISPLYVLHDYRIYLDHLLSNDEKIARVDNIVKTLGVTDFSEQEKIYYEEISRLKALFQILVVLSE